MPEAAPLKQKGCDQRGQVQVRRFSEINRYFFHALSRTLAPAIAAILHAQVLAVEPPASSATSHPVPAPTTAPASPTDAQVEAAARQKTEMIRAGEQRLKEARLALRRQ